MAIAINCWQINVIGFGTSRNTTYLYPYILQLYAIYAVLRLQHKLVWVGCNGARGTRGESLNIYCLWRQRRNDVWFSEMRLDIRSAYLASCRHSGLVDCDDAMGAHNILKVHITTIIYGWREILVCVEQRRTTSAQNDCVLKCVSLQVLGNWNVVGLTRTQLVVVVELLNVCVLFVLLLTWLDGPYVSVSVWVSWFFCDRCADAAARCFV